MQECILRPGWTNAARIGILISMNEPDSSRAPTPPDERLPAVPIPTAEVLKQILEQMLTNERRRVRNEFIRFGTLFLVCLLLVFAGGIWIVRDVLLQVQEARRMSEHSQDALLSLMASAGRPGAGKTGVPATPADDVQQAITELETQNLALARLMQSQDGELKGFLADVTRRREEEISRLRARVNAKQATAVAPDPDEVVEQPPGEPPLPTPTPDPAPPSTVTVTIPDQPPLRSLTADIAGDLSLRLPIPTP